MSDIAIEVQNISKKYLIGDTSSGNLRETLASWFTKKDSQRMEEFWALQDISFSVKRGEALGIIGKNGAGKSTLLKILSRITEPTTGRIEINGRVSSLLEVGTGFHAELTGRENVFLNGTVLGMSRAEVKAKFDEIVEFSGVEKFLDTPVKRYSSGMKVRLAFAVAAHLEPEILIIDEVLAVGDAEFQRKCLGKMEDVAGQGRTVLFVSHSMGAIQKLCNISMLLQNGCKVMYGNTEDAIAMYLDQNAGARTNDLSTALRENATYGEMARIISCNIYNSAGVEVTELKMGEAFKVRVGIHGVASIDAVSVIIGIDTPLGVIITTVASEEENIYFNSKEGEIVYATALFKDLTLNSGSYNVRIGLRKGKIPLDLIKNADTFQVLNISDNIQSSDSGLYGIVKSVPEWVTE